MNRTKSALRVLGVALLVFGLADILLGLPDAAVILVVAAFFLLNWKKEAILAVVLAAAGQHLLAGGVRSKTSWSVLVIAAIFLVAAFVDRYDVANTNRKIRRLNHPPQPDPDLDAEYSEYPGLPQ